MDANSYKKNVLTSLDAFGQKTNASFPAREVTVPANNSSEYVRSRQNHFTDQKKFDFFVRKTSILMWISFLQATFFAGIASLQDTLQAKIQVLLF